MRVGVIGGGSWGTTVAHLCSRNTPTQLYARRTDIVDAINTDSENPVYLPGLKLSRDLCASSDIAKVVGEADVLVMGVPSSGFRSTLVELRPHIRPWVPIVSLAKGLEAGTRKRMTEVARDELPAHPAGVLTGPNLAKEILAGDAAAAVIAFTDTTIAERLQPLFASKLFRVYTSTDVVGCEIAGVLKNVVALAAGMADGLGTGNNTRAAVITRGLAELTRLGVAMGGEASTFAGLAGLGDLLATCISPQSRNRHVGEQLGRGRTIEQIIAEMDQVAEGVKSANVVLELAADHGIDMPIAAEVAACIHEGRSASAAYRGLVNRPPTAETAPD